ncbi:hypothetical protein ABPG75_009287 [Micractinium tetrahymenae]
MPQQQEDGTANGTQQAPPPTAATCPDSSALWRSTPLAQSAASSEFTPEELDYWKGTVLGAAWPALIGLGIAAAALLIFLLWRCLRCCCCGCCCCGGGRGKRGGQPRYITARWLTCLKVLAALLLAGVAGGCALGMAHMDRPLVHDGVQVVDDVQDFLAGIISTGRAAVAAADGVGVMLGTLQGVLNTDVNATDLGLNLQCIVPWLDSLPNPAQLGADIQSARASVDSVLTPALSALSSALGSLAGALAPAPSPGAYTAALQTIAGAQALLTDSPIGLLPQAQAFAAAAQALEPSTEDPAALAAARSALSALLAAPQPLSDKLAALGDLAGALQTLQAAGTTDSYIPDAVAALTGIRGVALNVSAISAALRALQGNYTAAAPCVAALLGRAQHVNASVLVLPPEIDRPAALLADAQASLSGLMNATSPPASLADGLDAALPLAQVEAALAMMQLAVGIRSSIQGLGLPAIIAALQAAQGNLTAAQPQLTSAQSAMDSYAATYGLAGGMPAGGWSALAAGVQAAGAAVGAAAGQLPANSTAFSQASALRPQLPTVYAIVAAQQSKVAGMQGLLGSVPDVTPYLASLGGLEATYAALPQPPRQLALDAQAAIDDIVGSMQQTLTDGQATIRGETDTVRNSLDDAEAQSVGRLQSLKGDVLPTVHQLDTIRQGVLYGLFSGTCLVCLLLALSKMFNWPLGIKLLTVLTLLLCLVLFVGVLGLSFALKAGSDGCANLESQVVTRLPGLISDPADSAKALALARYYLLGEGGDVEAVLLAAFGFDAPDVLRQINTTREDLLQDVVRPFTLGPLLAVPVDHAVNLSYAIEDGVNALLVKASYAAVNPVYGTVKSFACCRTLDLAGWQWLALILAGSCAAAMCLLAFSFVASLDKLGRVKGCCACYGKKHFADEAPFATSQPSKGASGGEAAAAAARLSGTAAGAKDKPVVNLAVDARVGASPRSPGADQFIASWHSRHNSAALAQSTGGEAAERSGSSLRDQFHGSASGSPAVGSPGLRSARGTPRGSAAAAAAAAAALSAERAELFGSRGSGASAAGRGSGATATARSSGASAALGAEAHTSLDLPPGEPRSPRSSNAAAATAAGPAGGKSPPAIPEAAAEAEARTELLSPAKSATASTSSSKAGGKAQGPGSRLKSLFKVRRA